MEFEKPILMGLSMGAATVMRLGAEYPDLARANVMLDPFLAQSPVNDPKPKNTSKKKNRIKNLRFQNPKKFR